jgi:hypothetical protein
MPKIWLHEHVHIDNLRNLQGWEVRRNSNAYDVVHAFDHLYIREQWMETANVLHVWGTSYIINRVVCVVVGHKQGRT